MNVFFKVQVRETKAEIFYFFLIPRLFRILLYLTMYLNGKKKEKKCGTY